MELGITQRFKCFKDVKNSNKKCPIYNVGSDKVTSLRDLAKKIAKLVNKKTHFKKVLSAFIIFPGYYATLAHIIKLFLLSKINNRKNAELIIIHTEWEEFKALDFKKLNKKRNFKIYDMRNLYSPESMKKKGLNYYSIGRSYL